MFKNSHQKLFKGSNLINNRKWITKSIRLSTKKMKKEINSKKEKKIYE